MKILPTICPACNNRLKIKRLLCQQCETEIEGSFDLPNLGRLCVDDQKFILQFVKASGSLKEMARLLGLSYPTVRNQLDEIIKRIESEENNGKENQ